MTDKVQMSVGDRWAIIGGTGSGKTTFDVYLIRLYAALAYQARRLFPIYILDTKISGDFTHFTRKDLGHYHFGNSLPKLIDPMKDGKPYMVWQPEEDDTDMYDAFFQMIYQARRPALILVDELGSLTNSNATRFPRYYDILLKQGRGLNIGLISNTQSPSYIPPNLLRQTTHLVRFRLNDQYDAKKLAKQLGREYDENWEPPHEHGFVYRNCTKPRKSSPPVYYRDMQEFFGLTR